MAYQLSEDQIAYIVDFYGSNVETVNQIVDALNTFDLPFTEESFMEVIANVLLDLETEAFEKNVIKKTAKDRAQYTLTTAILAEVTKKFENKDEFCSPNTIEKIYTLKMQLKDEKSKM